MEYILSFLVFLIVLFFLSFLFFRFVKLLDVKFKKFKAKLKRKSDTHKNEQEKQKLKFLNAITGIHSARSSLNLKRSVFDFYQCIKYHRDYKLSFYDRDLNKLEIAMDKYIKYKLYKIYGIDESREILMEYRTYLKSR